MDLLLLVQGAALVHAAAATSRFPALVLFLPLTALASVPLPPGSNPKPLAIVAGIPPLQGSCRRPVSCVNDNLTNPWPLSTPA
jgi:hypothetical protein